MITCPACKENLRRELHLDQHAKREGDLTMCGNCETLLVIGADMQPRELTEAEAAIVDSNQGACMYIRILRATIRRAKMQRQAAKN
jgi:RNase P subunit RPR2